MTTNKQTIHTGEMTEQELDAIQGGILLLPTRPLSSYRVPTTVTIVVTLLSWLKRR